MAIKMNEPIGPATFGPLIARLTVGAYFMMAGLSKLQMLSAFVAQVKTFGVLPDNAASLYAVLLPYMETFIGGCFVLGLWTTMVGILASGLLISFVFAFGFFPGASDIFNKDVVLLGAVVCLLYTGPGAYSLDNVRKPPSAAH
jgi:putative oxidoreductase